MQNEFLSNKRLAANQKESGKVAYSSPSNLAIIKYWGKHGNQLPQNPSISLTLSTSKSITSLDWSKNKSDKIISVDFYFDGKKNDQFAQRIEKFLQSIVSIFPFLQDVHLVIKSKNTFPHSSGIASSASAMSALSLCLCEMEKEIFNIDEEHFHKKASFISRLGSGSASRSVFPYWAEWGQWEGNQDYSDLWATPLIDVHNEFMDVQDSILIASKSEKSVSSSAGHALMENNDYAPVRYAQANQRMYDLEKALQLGDWEQFGMIAENEALTLHALMMSSKESYLLMEPATITMIRKIRDFRNSTNLPVYFSLDAGPNIHILYPGSSKDQVHTFIKEELVELCEDGMVLYDHIGKGPEKLS